MVKEYFDFDEAVDVRKNLARGRVNKVFDLAFYNRKVAVKRKVKGDI